MNPDATIVGFTELVTVRGTKGERTVLARIDTGATKSSIDLRLAAELELGPHRRVAKIKSAAGIRLRPVVKEQVLIAGRTIRAELNLADRSGMRYKVLIGRNILKRGFLIDPSRESPGGRA